MTKLAFIDTETFGLNPDLHPIWEIGLVLGDQAYEFQIYHPPAVLAAADEVALQINGFRHRSWQLNANTPSTADAAETIGALAALLEGTTLVGMVPSFDEERLRRMYVEHFGWPEDNRFPWHYHLIDVETLAVGHLSAHGVHIPMPCSSDDLSAALGVTIDETDRHTALGDALWAKRVYDRIMEGTDR